MTYIGCKNTTKINANSIEIHSEIQKNEIQAKPKLNEINNKNMTSIRQVNLENEPFKSVNLTNQIDIQKENLSNSLEEQEKINTSQYIICIDPGHQSKGNYNTEPIGPGSTQKKPKVSSGTQGTVTGKYEYEFNLEFSFLLKNKLEALGVQVVMTRKTHDVDISNRERAEIANKSNADLFVRIHADGSENSNVKGFSILLPSQDCIYTNSIYDESKSAASLILDSVEKEDITVRGLMPRNDISGFNWSKVPVILIEAGFMTNPEEDQKLFDFEYQEKLANVVSKGILEYLNKSEQPKGVINQ